MVNTKLELYQVGPHENAYQFGYQIGRRFSSLIRTRLASDVILRTKLRPYASSPPGQQLIEALRTKNRTKFPLYWDELVGTADGSDVALLDIILINFRKEILPFIPKEDSCVVESMADDCSDVMVVSDDMAIVAHNEDANVALVGHTYLIKLNLCDGNSFTAYTYAGELPSCAFGFNTHGVAGGIARNFISRSLLEAKNIDDALSIINSPEVSVGHCYNLIDVRGRKIFNVETASKDRISVQEIKKDPFFHANMYLHLHISQVEDDNSRSRQSRAALLPKQSKHEFLSLLGNTDDKEYPIFMKGPTLYTLCTAVFDLDAQTLSVLEGNPKEKNVAYILQMAPHLKRSI
ncbi:hypothetical protein V2J09_014632 [Rumex salicifolius]